MSGFSSGLAGLVRRSGRGEAGLLIPHLSVSSWVLSVAWGVGAVLVLGGLLMGGLAGVAWGSFVLSGGLSVWFGYLFLGDVAAFVDECLDVWVEGGVEEL